MRAHLLRLFARIGFSGRVDVEDEMPPDVHALDTPEAEGMEGISNRLPLWIEQSLARDDVHSDAIAAGCHSCDSDGDVDMGAGAGAG